MRTFWIGFRGVALGLLAAAGLSMAANAATLSYTQTYGPASTDFTGTSNEVTLSQFNPNLGTLTSVALSVTETIGGSLTITPTTSIVATALTVAAQMMVIDPYAAPTDFTTEGCDYTYGNCLITDAYLTGADVKVLSYTNQTISSPTMQSFSNLSGTSGDSYSSSLADAAFSSTNKTVLGDYTGTGTFNAVLLTDAALEGTFSGTGTISQTTTASGSVTVTYTYDTPVPEPASFAVFGGAMLALGAALRRGKRSSRR